MQKWCCLLLSLVVALTMAACCGQEEEGGAADIAFDTVTVIAAEGEYPVSVAAQKKKEISFQATGSSGKVMELNIYGFDLLPYLAEQGVDLSRVVSYSLESAAGYSFEVNAADAGSGLWLSAAELVDRETVMSAVPGASANSLVKDLVSITLNYE